MGRIWITIFFFQQVCSSRGREILRKIFLGCLGLCTPTVVFLHSYPHLVISSIARTSRSFNQYSNSPILPWFPIKNIILQIKQSLVLQSIKPIQTAILLSWMMDLWSCRLIMNSSPLSWRPLKVCWSPLLQANQCLMREILVSVHLGSLKALFPNHRCRLLSLMRLSQSSIEFHTFDESDPMGWIAHANNTFKLS